MHNPLRSGWYRPRAFILQYQIVTGLFGWHNIFAFKCKAMLAMAASIHFVAEKLTDSIIAAVIEALAGTIHPVTCMLPAVYVLG
jgi:hypothetical protein